MAVNYSVDWESAFKRRIPFKFVSKLQEHIFQIIFKECEYFLWKSCVLFAYDESLMISWLYSFVILSNES